MSDTYLRFIAHPPNTVPGELAEQRAVSMLESVLPDAELVEVTRLDRITFFDCGENLEAVICPLCGAGLSLDYMSEPDDVQDWWDSVFSGVETNEDSTHLEISETDSVAMLCCGQAARIIDLRFDWPAAFGRFEVSVMNPDVGEEFVTPELMTAIREALGTDFKVVWALY